MDIAIEGCLNPEPKEICKIMNAEHVFIMTGDSKIQSQPDELYLTLYNPDEKLLALAKSLATSERLFLWQPPQ